MIKPAVAELHRFLSDYNLNGLKTLTSTSCDWAVKKSHPRTVKLLSVFVVVCSISHTCYAVECRNWHASDAEKFYQVGNIIVEPGDIFNLDNPDENHKIHRLANSLHIKTKESVIREQLLFKSGDKLDLNRLEETARNLRANSYIKDAYIDPVRVCGSKVDIKVRTTDHWTLTPNISFHRSGGSNTSGVEIEEQNLFGTGREFVLSYEDNIERNEILLRYKDPQFHGSNRQLTTGFLDNSDGEGYELNYTLPFYQLNSREAWGGKVKTLKQRVSLYENGDLAFKLGEDQHQAELFAGWSDGLQADEVERIRVGWTYNYINYFEVDTNTPPPSLTESYPWVEYQYLQDKFIKATDFQTRGVVEDISLGRNYSIRAGLLTEDLGSDDTYLRVSGQFSRGFQFNGSQIALLDATASTYIGRGVLQGIRTDIFADWHWYHHRDLSFVVAGRMETATNLQPTEQIILDGDNGLRGYPTNFQNGDRSLLFSVEERLMFDWYPYRLAKFGAVLFADTGAAWFDGEHIDFVSNVGLGFRLVSTRSSSAKVLHIDFSFPINAPDGIDSFQILISTKNTL